MREVDIGIIPATIPLITQVNVVYCWVYLLIIALITKVFMVKTGDSSGDDGIGRFISWEMVKPVVDIECIPSM